MLALLLGLLRMVWLFGKGQRGVVLENLALRQQLSVYKRKHHRKRFAARDRWFWDRTVSVVERLATSFGRGPSRLGHALAARAVRSPLELVFKEAWNNRAASGQPAGSDADSNLSGSEPVVASAAHSWGATQARNCGF